MSANASARHDDIRRLFAGPCDFSRGVTTISSLPPDGLPEVAFAGRSNVGKSSLVNALTGRKTLARTSSKPGHTQQLNFFNLGGKLMLVDLPGYGYAKTSKSTVKAWTQLIRDYLQGRRELQRLFLLVDGRHGLKPGDEEMMHFLDEMAVIYQIVLTKMDKVPEAQRESLLQGVTDGIANHGAAMPLILPTSSAKKQGIEALRAEIAVLAGV